MKAYDDIIDKLNHFTRKYYSKMLIKGILLFLTLGMIFTFFIVGIEYLLWLGNTWRMLLFFCLLLLTLVLFYKFIVVPILFLFRLKRGLTYKEASRLIGAHFPDVADKLYNLFDLTESKYQSELLLASIEQRSNDLGNIPFVKAIDYMDIFKYARYLLIPILVFIAIYISGNLNSFFSSYNRVLNYDVAYAPPAPFTFHLLNNDLKALEDKSYTIQVTTLGSVRPDFAYIDINGKELILQKEDDIFSYTFSPPLQDSYFQFVSGNIKSEKYQLEVVDIPSIQSFEMKLVFPGYLKRENEILRSTGSAFVPEGTEVTWNIKGENTGAIHLVDKDTVWNFSENSRTFTLSKSILFSYDYQITASNDNVKDYEKLDYSFTVIKDAFPTIKVQQVLDSLNPNTSYYVGESTDDYGLRSITLVCYDIEQPESKQVINLLKPNSNYSQFYYTFPSGLVVNENVDYEFYFQANDNDGINGSKGVKSKIFRSRLLNENELINKDLQIREAIIKNMDRSLDKLAEQDKELDKINRAQKEKKELNFNDQNEIKNFLKKQKVQEELMQNYSKQLQESLKKTDSEDENSKLLQERLERQEIEARKNEKLLDELNKIADKIDKEELSKRLDELGKKQQNSKRNLEQLLELTKRYYVTEKVAQMANELKKLAEKQELLANKPKTKEDSKDQEKLNVDFDDFTKEFKELQKDNDRLKKPIDLNYDSKKEESIKEDQKSIVQDFNETQSLDSNKDEQDSKLNLDKIGKKQKSASDKMKEMAEKLESSASDGGGSTITEDAEMLRQILDNLVIFSFNQEKLFDDLEETDLDVVNFSKSVRDQKELRSLFEHVDDSLFALSLRRAELSEYVNEQITEVYYNIDKSLESIADNQMYQGVSYQKYVLNASNGLADFLANILDNMQQSMQAGSGSGKGEPGFQLPDIIKGQGDLKEKMEGMGDDKSGQAQGEGQEQKGENGENGQKGEGEEGNAGGDTKGNGDKKNSRGKDDTIGNEGVNGIGEEELKEIYEIYKQQQMLRNQLEDELKEMIDSDERKLGEKLIKQMEDFENDLLENGITKRTVSKVNNIEHELLKLENATLSKGRKSERESSTNLDLIRNPILSKPAILDGYKNNIEILNRQALPLRQNYQIKVKDYFERND